MNPSFKEVAETTSSCILVTNASIPASAIKIVCPTLIDLAKLVFEQVILWLELSCPFLAPT